MKNLVLYCAFLSLFTFTTAGLAKDCSYEKFRPQFLTDKILYDFNQAGLGQIPLHTKDENGTELTKSTVIRDTGAVAVVQFQKDIREQNLSFTLWDIRGRRLLEVTEKKRGVSRTELEVYSDFEHYSDMPFLTILHFPAGGTYHYVGVKDEGITTFYSIFKETWEAAKGAILGETSPNNYAFKSPREKFLFRVQANPDLAPYYSLLSVTENNKKFRVTGTVPSNYTYGLVARLAQEEFGFSTRIDLTIDERIRVVMEPPTCR